MPGPAENPVARTSAKTSKGMEPENEPRSCHHQLAVHTQEGTPEVRLQQKHNHAVKALVNFGRYFSVKEPESTVTHLHLVAEEGLQVALNGVGVCDCLLHLGAPILHLVGDDASFGADLIHHPVQGGGKLRDWEKIRMGLR